MASYPHIYLVQHLLEASAKRLPDKVALICGDQRLTYSEINEKADRLAAALLEMGIERQDRIAVFMDNSAESVISLFGVLKAGGIFIMANPTMKARKLKYVLENSGARTLISHKNKNRIVNQAVENGSGLRNSVWVGGNIESLKLMPLTDVAHYKWDNIVSQTNQRTPPVPSATIDVDLAAIVYTSGSTGKPKGVMCAHYNVLSVVRSVSLYLENNENDIVLCTLPLSFGYGLYQVLVAFLTGGTIVLEKSFAFPYRIAERLAEEKATGFALVPTMAALLLQLEGLSKLDFSNLRYITNAAAALPVAHIKKLQELWPNTQIYSMYGLTEGVRGSYLPPDLINERPDSVGIPIPNEEVWIVDDKGRKVGPNEMGELVIRGSNVMQGYWKDPKETEMRFKVGPGHRDRLLHTGDLFRQDNDGYLYFVSRKDDLINTKGERVSPKEIENCLCEIEAVGEAVVIGVPDEIWGQAIKAFIVAKHSGQPEKKALIHHCQKNLEPFMVPKYVQFLGELPKLPNGKIDKRKLKKKVN